MKFNAIFKPDIASAVKAALAMMIFLFSCAQTALAQAVPARDPSDARSSAIVERYPSGTIQSVATADQALADVQQQRSLVEARFSDAERACYSKFFVTACIDSAKELRRRALIEIQQVEIEANAFKRRARVEARDKALADKAPLIAPIVKPAREQPKDSEADAQKKEADAAQRAAASRDRAAQHAEKMEKLKIKDAADAQKRAENVAAFEKKARDAEARQRKVAEKKAEKERSRPPKTAPEAPAGN